MLVVLSTKPFSKYTTNMNKKITFSSVGHPAETTSPASEAKRLAASANKSVDHSDTENN